MSRLPFEMDLTKLMDGVVLRVVALSHRTPPGSDSRLEDEQERAVGAVACVYIYLCVILRGRYIQCISVILRGIFIASLCHS